MNSLRIFQNNINGFYSKCQILEQNLYYNQPHICLLQEGFRSEKKNIDHQFQYLYVHHWSETGRAGILCRRDIHSKQRTFISITNKFQVLGYESCWVEISHPNQKQPILFCSLYRNVQNQRVVFGDEENSIKQLFSGQIFDLEAFEQELKFALQVSQHILIGGDWNAHHPAWLDKNVDAIGEVVLDFITANNLHILNSMPFDCTYFKDGASTCIDLSLCSTSLVHLCNNWRTTDDTLDVHSDHLPITFNIQANWSPSNNPRQSFETWNFHNIDWAFFSTN